MAFFQFLFVHETVHLIASAVIALLLWKVYSNRWVIAISLIAGLLIDIDHLFDYVIDYPRVVGPIFDLSKITLYDYMSSAGKVYVLFHSLDFIWIWWFVGRFLNSKLKVKGIEWALILPIVLHIFVDYASYTPHPLGYFLLFRIFHNFSQDRFNGG